MVVNHTHVIGHVKTKENTRILKLKFDWEPNGNFTFLCQSCFILLTTGSEERGVLGVGSNPVAIHVLLLVKINENYCIIIV